jgi:uncharacterized small protein (DUF1192 family)
MPAAARRHAEEKALARVAALQAEIARLRRG